MPDSYLEDLTKSVTERKEQEHSKEEVAALQLQQSIQDGKEAHIFLAPPGQSKELEALGLRIIDSKSGDLLNQYIRAVNHGSPCILQVTAPQMDALVRTKTDEEGKRRLCPAQYHGLIAFKDLEYTAGHGATFLELPGTAADSFQDYISRIDPNLVVKPTDDELAAAELAAIQMAEDLDSQGDDTDEPSE